MYNQPTIFPAITPLPLSPSDTVRLMQVRGAGALDDFLRSVGVVVTLRSYENVADYFKVLRPVQRPFEFVLPHSDWISHEGLSLLPGTYTHVDFPCLFGYLVAKLALTTTLPEGLVYVNRARLVGAGAAYASPKLKQYLGWSHCGELIAQAVTEFYADFTTRFQPWLMQSTPNDETAYASLRLPLEDFHAQMKVHFPHVAYRAATFDALVYHGGDMYTHVHQNQVDKDCQQGSVSTLVIDHEDVNRRTSAYLRLRKLRVLID